MKKIIVVVVCQVVLFHAVIALAAYSLKYDPHSFGKTECANCHVNYEKSPAKLVRPLTKLCRHCHRSGITRLSHPVDVLPRNASVPHDMPLQNGEITCNTCHNVHALRVDAYGTKTYYLRSPLIESKRTCDVCHVARSKGHVQALTAIHVRTVLKQNKNHYLDGLSADCISCHDGGRADLVSFKYGASQWDHGDGPHPIGVNFESKALRNKNLKPISKINKKIKFFKRKIGCGTCHDPFSTRPALLVMSNKKSELCSECHNM